MPLIQDCPSCGSQDISAFYQIQDMPVHSVLLLSSREEALHFPACDVSLGFCGSCGFIFNMTYDPGLLSYSARYEGTQAFSATFNIFHKKLAERLIERYDLREKNILEIGCGQGEFLILLCELGNNRGIGFDPAYDLEKEESEYRSRITFIPDFYSEKYADRKADFVCCKMTLEHISQTSLFMQTVRRAIGGRFETIVFFQVPNVRRILDELAFWDVYYEHSSYFSLGSLARLFRNCGFNVLDLWLDYDDQYVMIEAKPSSGDKSHALPQENDLDELVKEIDHFTAHLGKMIGAWKEKIQDWIKARKKIVIWGASSKGVAFLNTLKIKDGCDYAVDINPYKRGTFIAGTGQQIVSPSFLKEYKPDVVIVMNPVYCSEIQEELDRFGLNCRLFPV
jgi:SAM-dependent methyltransferase